MRAFRFLDRQVLGNEYLACVGIHAARSGYSAGRGVLGAGGSMTTVWMLVNSLIP
jgi:hypothetical protein